MVKRRKKATRFVIDTTTPRGQRIYACQVENVAGLFWSRRQFHYYRVVGVLIRATGKRLFLDVKRDGRGFWTTREAIEHFNAEMNRLEGL